MISSPFRLSDEVVNSLCGKHPPQAIEKMQNEGRYPSNEHLRQLIETSFWASIRKEEGRSISFSLMFGQPTSYHFADPFIFDESITFDVENLVKLSLAINDKKQFGIYQTNKNRLEIWGFGSKQLIGQSSIKSFGAGRLVVSLGSHSMLVTGDKASFLQNANILKESLLKQKSFETNSHLDRECLFYKSGNVLDSCRYITEAIRAKGHGGTLLVMPENSNWQQLFEPIRYLGQKPWLRATETLNALLQKLHQRHTILDSVDLGQIEYERNQLLLEALRGASLDLGKLEKTIDLSYEEGIWQLEHEHNQTLDDIATLASVDGAVVLNYDLSVLAFGAKIKRQNIGSDRIPLLLNYPFAESEENDEEPNPTWGTRHQSAAELVFGQKDSLAFVVSEDNIITAFTFDSYINSVIASRHLEYLTGSVLEP